MDEKMDGNGQIHIKGVGGPNLLGDNIGQYYCWGTYCRGSDPPRIVLCNTNNGVVRANKPNLLKEFRGTLELTDR